VLNGFKNSVLPGWFWYDSAFIVHNSAFKEQIMTLLYNGTLVTLAADRRIIRDGAIWIQGKQIKAVGKYSDLQAQYGVEPGNEAEKINLNGKLVIPGLVDTHVHLAQAMIRGCADDMNLIPWLLERVWVLQGNYEGDDGRVSAALCMAEMLKSGTTAFIEVLFAGRYGFEAVAELVEQSGIRAAIGKIVMDTGTYAESNGAMHPGMVEDRVITVRDTLRYFDEYNGTADGRLQVWFGPRTPGGCTPELYREVAALAKERGMGLTVHLAEVKSDMDFISRQYGLTPLEFAADLGLLDLGAKCVFGHGIWLADKDIALLAQTGATISHNPSSNMKLASGFCRVPELLAAGCNVALGCDGGPSNNSYDLIREMKLAAVIHKGRTLDPKTVDAEAVLEMATLNGAKAMGLADSSGSLEAGKAADLVIIDPNSLHLTPFDTQNPVSALVYAAHGGDVESVMINGKWVVWKRELQTLDEEKLKAEARAYAAQLYGRANLKISSRWNII
jgi:cytosine/adenosine deaminase-related metal-dependent hydrolase